MVIRPAIIKDLAAIFAMGQALRQESMWGMIPIEPNESYAHVQLLTILQNPKERLVVAVDDEKIVGFAGGLLITHRFMPNAPVMQEWALYLMPRYRGIGYGKALWGDLVKWAHDVGAYGAVYGRIRHAHDGRAQEELVWRIFDREPSVREVSYE